MGKMWAFALPHGFWDYMNCVFVVEELQRISYRTGKVNAISLSFMYDNLAVIIIGEASTEQFFIWLDDCPLPRRDSLD